MVITFLGKKCSDMKNLNQLMILTGQFVISWASKGYCIFVTLSGVMSLLACCVQIHRLGHFLHRGQDSSFLGSSFFYYKIRFFPYLSPSFYRRICRRCWMTWIGLFMFHVVGCSHGHHPGFRQLVNLYFTPLFKAVNE